MTDMDITSHITQEQGISNNTGKNAKQSKTQMPQKPYKSQEQEQEQLSGDDIFDALLDEVSYLRAKSAIAQMGKNRPNIKNHPKGWF